MRIYINIFSQSIKCSAKTADGRLWFGTVNGLTLFDPNNETFRTFILNKKQGLQIESIFVDDKNNLWIASLSNGLLYFDTKTYQFKSYSHLTRNLKIHLVVKINENELLIDTDDNQLILVSLASQTSKKLLVPQKSDKPATISRIIKYSNEVFLLATSQGLYSFHRAKKKVEPSFQILDDKFGLLNVTDVCRSGDKNNI